MTIERKQSCPKCEEDCNLRSEICPLCGHNFNEEVEKEYRSANKERGRYDLSINGARDKTYKAPTLGDLLRAQAQKRK